MQQGASLAIVHYLVSLVGKKNRLTKVELESWIKETVETVNIASHIWRFIFGNGDISK